MLWEAWQEVLADNADRVAIWHAAGSLTFHELDRLAAGSPEISRLHVARGGLPDVAVATLRAWQQCAVLLPLERDASLPDLAVEDFPPGTAHLKLTPGIEGQPRAVYFTAAQMAADAARLVRAMSLTPQVPNIAAISVTHSYGFSSIVLPLLLHGIPAHCVEVPFPRMVADALNAHEKAVLPAVPSMWKAWIRAGCLNREKIALAISSGAPLSLELERAAWETCGLKLHNFYGTSECGGISYDASSAPRTCAEDLGLPLPGVEVSVSPEGRLTVRSSSVALGYQASRPDESLGDGHFITRDTGRIVDGRLMLENSGADSINVAGRKIGPSKIEAVLMATGLLERVRVHGVRSQDAERVEEIVALIQLSPGASVQDLKHAAAERLAGWELPRRWTIPADAADWTASRADLKRRG
jgi:long-chain acyl-CoA synthetase